MNYFAKNIIRFTSILLLLTFFIFTGGTYLIFKIVKYHNRQEIKSLFRKDCLPLVVLKYTQAEYKLIEKIKKDEIRIDGQIYDIKEIKMINDTLHIYAYHDIRETFLYNNLVIYALTDPINKTKKKHFAALIYNILNTKFVIGVKNNLFLIFPVVTKKWYSFVSKLKYIFIDVQLPPPKIQ